MHNKVVFIIAGPTGVGKTLFSDFLSSLFPIEIINMDVGQFYVPLCIGTAKPDWKASRTPHHFFDILDRPLHFNVVSYRAALVEKIGEIHNKNRIPTIVGGSTLYLKNLFFPITLPAFEKNEEGAPGVPSWKEVYAIDPIAAEKIGKNDQYRLERINAIWRNTKQPPSSFSLQFDFAWEFKLWYFIRDRQELYRIIDDRVHQMMQLGWIDEVQSLLHTDWRDFLMKKKLIGYNDLLTYLEGDMRGNCLDNVLHVIQRRTRSYAKRQLIFWRMLKKLLVGKNVCEVNLSHTPFEKIPLPNGLRKS